MFSAGYTQSPYKTQIRFVFKRLSSQEFIDEINCFNVSNVDNTLWLILTFRIRHTRT